MFRDRPKKRKCFHKIKYQGNKHHSFPYMNLITQLFLGVQSFRYYVIRPQSSVVLTGCREKRLEDGWSRDHLPDRGNPG